MHRSTLLSASIFVSLAAAACQSTEAGPTASVDATTDTGLDTGLNQPVSAAEDGDDSDGGPGTSVSDASPDSPSDAPADSPTDAPSDGGSAEADAFDASPDSPTDDAPLVASCTDRRPHCGPCDTGDWAPCVDGVWSCADAGFAFTQLGCECWTSSLWRTCCPRSDSGARTSPVCTPSADAAAGLYGTGILSCPKWQPLSE